MLVHNEFKENKLRWLGHIQQRPVSATVKKHEKVIVN